jgi:hypothetical protein
MGTPLETDGGSLRVPSRSGDGEGQRYRRRNQVRAVGGLSGVLEDDMPRKSDQRKHGTTRRSPRPAGTARASPISRKAVKWWRAGEWGGWGRLSVDGPGQNNPDRSEGPWGRGKIPSNSGTRSNRATRTQSRDCTEWCYSVDCKRVRRAEANWAAQHVSADGKAPLESWP